MHQRLPLARSHLYWLSIVIILLLVANGVVFYKLIGLYLAGASLTENNNVATADQIGQRQQQATGEEKNATAVVPILMYHYVRDYTNPNDPLGIQLSVSPAVLHKQLQKLKDAGYETISLEDFSDGKLKNKSIILTFDDGYTDHYTAALPVLKEVGMTGTFFIVKSFIGRDGYMSAKEITELQEAGMEIGGHTINHKNLATQTYEVAYQEIRDSLRGTAPVFAYPSGKYSNVTVGIINNLGIKATVTTNLGLAATESDFDLLPRIRVKQHTDILKVIAEQQYLLQNPEVNPDDVSLPASQAN